MGVSDARSRLLLLTVVCATLAHARRAEALSCEIPTEHFTATLVSVTVNGAPASDLAPWQRHDISVVGSGNDGLSFNAYRSGEASAYGYLGRVR